MFSLLLGTHHSEILAFLLPDFISKHPEKDLPLGGFAGYDGTMADILAENLLLQYTHQH